MKIIKSMIKIKNKIKKQKTNKSLFAKMFNLMETLNKYKAINNLKVDITCVILDIIQVNAFNDK